MPGLASMDGVSYGKAEPFTIPEYHYEPVRSIVKATDLTGYYDNLLDDAFERDVEDFTCKSGWVDLWTVLIRSLPDGLSPKITKRVLARAADGFNWSEWRDKLNDMGDHFKVSKVAVIVCTASNVHL